MARRKSDIPDFFDDDSPDPMQLATGRETPTVRKPAPVARPKRKAGFYLSEELLARFNRKFHELKLSGAAIDNNSSLLEMALGFALDDMDKGGRSRLLKGL